MSITLRGGSFDGHQVESIQGARLVGPIIRFDGELCDEIYDREGNYIEQRERGNWSEIMAEQSRRTMAWIFRDCFEESDGS